MSHKASVLYVSLVYRLRHGACLELGLVYIHVETMVAAQTTRLPRGVNNTETINASDNNTD